MHRRSRRNPTPPVGKDRSILIGIGVGLGVVTLGGAWLWHQNRKSLDTLRLVGTLADTITPRVLALLPNPPPGGLRDLSPLQIAQATLHAAELRSADTSLSAADRQAATDLAVSMRERVRTLSAIS